MTEEILGGEVKKKAGFKIWALWIIQSLLAALFIFSGVIKLISPIAALIKEFPLPVLFVRFIGVCEILGGLGLVLPGIFKKQLFLTPLAAIGLVIIMIGAVVVTVMTMGLVPAIMPLVVGILCVLVARGRWSGK